MKRRGTCPHHHEPLHPPTVQSPQTSSGKSSSASVCTRLYAQACELREHKDWVYHHFSLQRVSASSSIGNHRSTGQVFGSFMQSTTASYRSSSRTTTRTTPTAPSNAVAGPSKERHVSTAYVQGGRAPSAAVGPNASLKGFANTSRVSAVNFSLQSTMASRAAVAPRRGLSSTRQTSPPPPPVKVTTNRSHSTRKPTSSTNASTRITSTSRRQSTADTTKRVMEPRPQSVRKLSIVAATNSVLNPASPSRRLSSVNVSASTTARGEAIDPPQQRPRPQLQRMKSANSVLPANSAAARPRGSILQSRPDSTAPRRRPSTAQPQHQHQQEPVFVHVSRRTSSPIVNPAIGGGVRRRPSVAPIGSSNFGANSDFSTPTSVAATPRASFLRRDNRLEKLQEQVNVLKASLGLSDEDLQWRVESAKGNAFLVAEQHLAACEERYDRLAFEMQQLSQPELCAHEDEANVKLTAKLRALEQLALQVVEHKSQLTGCQTAMTQAKQGLLSARIEAELQRATHDEGECLDDPEVAAAKHLELTKDALLATQRQVKADLAALQTSLEDLYAETDRFAASIVTASSSNASISSLEVVEAKKALLSSLRTIPECAPGSDRLTSLCSQAVQLATRITASRSRDMRRTETELERAMRDVEVWKTRREQAKEFDDEMRKREVAWQAQHRDANAASLARLRTLIPFDIADLSIETLIARARDQAGDSVTLLTYDLATYLKTNRFLHWLVTHEDDIARANFLAADSAPFFLDLAAYDVEELRALAAVMPESFAFDKDGRKRAWRTSFMEHVRTLVAQQQGETILAGWDPERQARRRVKLPELTARQQLNPVYCYPAEAELDARLDKFERQRARLKAKRARLQELEDQLVPQAKAEYVAVAEDARNDELQRVFGKATLITLRDEAKRQHLALCKERDGVRSELKHGERAWEAQTPTYEQFQAEVTQIRALPAAVRTVERIVGPFPAEIDLQPRERAAFKKLSVEEEAEARKRELDRAIAKRSQDISDIASAVDTETSVELEQQGENSVIDTWTVELAAMRLEDKTPNVETEEAVGPQDTVIKEDKPLMRGFRQVKSLRVAVGVLQFLEKDFCSPARVKRGSEGGDSVSPSVQEASEANSRSSRSSLESKTPYLRRKSSNPSVAGTNDSADVVADSEEAKSPPDLEAVQPKSKALLRLLEARKAEEDSGSSSTEGAAEIVTGRPARSPFGGAGGKPNFLRELQNRVRGNQAAAESEVAVSSSGSVRPPANFLEELKLKRAAKLSGSGEATPKSSVKPAARVEAPRNFLDELKARAAGKNSAVDKEAQ